MSTRSDNPFPAWNALKHGLRSAAILLPADDASEFERLRRDLFQTYRPGTADEAACVEAMATHHWRIARCRRWQAVYDAQTDALLTGDLGGLAGHICERDSHRWIHKAMDCTLQESRLDRLLCRARDKLLLLQKLRRNNLVAGAVERAPDFLGMESPVHGDGGDAMRPASWDQDESPVPASPSEDGEISENTERTGYPPSERALPVGRSEHPHGWGVPPRAPTGSLPRGKPGESS